MTVKENILKVMNDILMDSQFIAMRAKVSNEQTRVVLQELLKEGFVKEINDRWRRT